MTKLLLVLLAGASSLAAFALELSVRPYQTPASISDYRAALDSTKTFAQRLIVARAFRDRAPDDVELQLLVSTELAQENVEATRKFYADRAEANPQNLAALFLAGRMSASPRERQDYADKILQVEPDNYWGNALRGTSMTFDQDQGLVKAEQALRKAIDANPSQPYAVAALGEIFERRDDPKSADEVYAKLAGMQPERFEPIQLRLRLCAGDIDKATKLVTDFLKQNPAHVDALYTLGAAQREQADWTGYVRSMRKAVAAEPRGENYYNLACAFTLSGMTDSAFTALFAATDGGYNDLEQYKQDEDLIPIKSDPRWDDLLNRIEANQQKDLLAYMQEMAKTAPQRREAAIEQRLGAEAPDFTVNGLDGKDVKLSSLRGKVVILDFWATWCGPCRKTMPLLDKFYSESRPAGVEVFGVNVWERGGTGGVKPFVEERGIHFPILLGTDEIARNYGVQGIPTLVVIDKNGKIAYRHVGYDPSLGESLEWQTKELLK
ncbi:redoxin domain-containing protein [candidate division KSB1 bacterium]|nr:redoxin domain-containing protein [candidate division KSB1 bacterium]